MSNAIRDKFTALNVARQRKYQLRHPDRQAARIKRYDQSEAGKASKRERNARYRAKEKQRPQEQDRQLTNALFVFYSLVVLLQAKSVMQQRSQQCGKPGSFTVDAAVRHAIDEASTKPPIFTSERSWTISGNVKQLWLARAI